MSINYARKQAVALSACAAINSIDYSLLEERIIENPMLEGPPEQEIQRRPTKADKKRAKRERIAAKLRGTWDGD